MRPNFVCTRHLFVLPARGVTLLILQGLRARVVHSILLLGIRLASAVLNHCGRLQIQGCVRAVRGRRMQARLAQLLVHTARLLPQSRLDSVALTGQLRRRVLQLCGAVRILGGGSAGLRGLLRARVDGGGHLLRGHDYVVLFGVVVEVHFLQWRQFSRTRHQVSRLLDCAALRLLELGGGVPVLPGLAHGRRALASIC